MSLATQRKKTVLVTGASSGIGHSLAVEFAKRGYHVFACARRLAPMQDLADKYGVEVLQMDVASTESIIKGKEYILTRLAELQPELAASNSLKLDILYNNAGISITVPTIDVTDDQLNSIYNINVLGPMKLVREFSDVVINAKGLIAFTGSIGMFVPIPFKAFYGSTKAAIDQYASILAIEMKAFDVKVINFVTGSVVTDITNSYSLPKTSKFYCDAMVKALDGQEVILEEGVKSDDYAADVITCIERHSSKSWSYRYYKGSMAVASNVIRYILPRSWIVNMLMGKLQLVEPFKQVKATIVKSFKRD